MTGSRNGAVRKRGRPRVEGLTERRREEILDAAREVFARDGFEKADVQDVADAIGVGKGTVYRYFPSKRELFLAAVDRGMRRLREEVDRATEAVDDPLEKLSAAVRAYLAFFEARPELVELFIQERAAFPERTKPTYFEHRESNVVEWHERYRALMRAGRMREMPPERVADVLGSLLYGAMLMNYFGGRGWRGRGGRAAKPLEAQAAEILDVVFNGILTDSERARQGGEGASRKGRPS